MLNDSQKIQLLNEALTNIVFNHEVIPDPSMQGATDTASVPLDDIDYAKEVLNLTKEK